jgi:hypothetical protein
MKPVRNPIIRWEKYEKGIRLIIPLDESQRKTKGFLSKILPAPPTEKRIELDKNW